MMKVTICLLFSLTSWFILSPSFGLSLKDQGLTMDEPGSALEQNQKPSSQSAVPEGFSMLKVKKKVKKSKKGKKETSLDSGVLGGPCTVATNNRCTLFSQDSCRLLFVETDNDHHRVNTNLSCEISFKTCNQTFLNHSELCSGTCVNGPPIYPPKKGDNCTTLLTKGCAPFDTCKFFPGGTYQRESATANYLKCNQRDGCSNPSGSTENFCSGKCIAANEFN